MIISTARPRTRRTFTLDALETRRLHAAVAGSLDATKTFQTMDSLGACVIHWLHQPEQQQAAFYDQLVNDLGASGVRAPAMPTFEAFNDNNDPNVFDWSKFDSKQMAHVLQFDQRMKERGVSSFFLSVWAPPSWMKTNRSHLGGGSLRADMRAEFAEYLAAMAIASKRDFGIDLEAISIQNEPYFPEPYESSMYDAAMMRETVVAVQKKFAREGIATKVMINEDVVDINRWKWFNAPTLADDEVDRSKLIVASHWMSSTDMLQQAAQLEGTGVPLWYTEVSGKGGDWLGGVSTARELSDTLTRANASAYYYWTYNDPMVAPPAAQTPSLMANGVPNGKYHALKHYYKYVRPGMERVQTSIDETSGMRLSAFRDPNSRASTIVLLNDSNSEHTITLNLAGLGAGTAAFRGFRSSMTETWQSMGTLDGNGTSLNVTIPPKAIITLHNGVDPAPATGNGSPPLPIYPIFDAVSASGLRRAAMLGDLNEVNRLIANGSNVNSTDPTTLWTPLHAAAAGVYPASEAIVDALLAAGANVTATDIEGLTPLHAAAMNQFVEYRATREMKSNIAGKLIDRGAAVDARDIHGRTPLIWSAMVPASTDYANYNTRMQILLTSRGADQLAYDNSGRTAYDYAAQEYKSILVSHLAGPGRDRQAPVTRFGQFSRDRNAVSMVITEDVTATLEPADVRVVNRATGTVVPFTLSETFSSGLTIARAQFASRLPDGQYRLTVAANTFTDLNGLANAAISIDFGVMAGDANGDGRVNFNDLVVVAQNYGRSGRTYSSGDFTGDGKVDFGDLVILAQRYESAPPQIAAVELAQQPPAKVTRRKA